MRLLLITLIAVLALLEYRFWFGADNVFQVWRLRKKIINQEHDLSALRLANRELSIKINNMKKYPEVIEEQARYELGLVKRGEKYYQIIEPLE